MQESSDRALKSWVTRGPAVRFLLAWEALLFYFSWNDSHGWSFNKINHSWRSASIQQRRYREKGVWRRKKERKNEIRLDTWYSRFILLLVFLIWYIRPQTCLRKHSDLNHSPTFFPGFSHSTPNQLRLIPSLHLSLSFPSFPRIFPPSFQFPLSLTHEPRWWFLVGPADFGAVYRRDLRKSASDKQIPLDTQDEQIHFQQDGSTRGYSPNYITQ